MSDYYVVVEGEDGFYEHHADLTSLQAGRLSDDLFTLLDQGRITYYAVEEATPEYYTTGHPNTLAAIKERLGLLDDQCVECDVHPAVARGRCRSCLDRSRARFTEEDNR